MSHRKGLILQQSLLKIFSKAGLGRIREKMGGYTNTSQLRDTLTHHKAV